MADEQVVLEKGAVVEIDADVIAQIIIQNCHCGVGRAQRAANLILSYMAGVVAASGKTTIVSDPPAGLQ